MCLLFLVFLLLVFYYPACSCYCFRFYVGVVCGFVGDVVVVAVAFLFVIVLWSDCVVFVVVGVGDVVLSVDGIFGVVVIEVVVVLVL